VRQKPLHQADLVFLTCQPELRGNADAGIVFPPSPSHAGHEVPKVHLRQQLGVNGASFHAGLVDELIVHEEIAAVGAA